MVCYVFFGLGVLCLFVFFFVGGRFCFFFFLRGGGSISNFEFLLVCYFGCSGCVSKKTTRLKIVV